MTNGLMSIGNLFDGSKKFIIPKYQRAYAWEEEHWEDFYDDIYYHDKNKKYFFGTILLKESPISGDFEELEIVDGQQRLTTLIIFIYCALKKIKQLKPKENIELKRDKYIEYHKIHKLTITQTDNTFFQTYIINKNKPTLFDTPSQKKLFDCKSKFTAWLNDEKIDTVLKMINILDSAEIVVYSVKDSAEASLIFETTNDRGKDLTQLEKIKSHLMYLAYLSAGKQSVELIDNIFNRFGDIYKIFERITQKRDIAEDSICQYHFIGYFSWTKKNEYQNYMDFIKNKFNELLWERKNKQIIKLIDNYTISLRECFQNLETIINLNNINLNGIFYLGSIALFYPLMLIIYDKNGKKELIELIKIIEKFHFKVLSLKFKRTNDIDTALNSLVRDYKGNFNNLKLELLKRIKQYAPHNSFIIKLKSPDFYNEYNSNVKNYFFWKYENYLRIKEQPIVNEMPFEELNCKSSKFRITIEHITSQTPLKGLKFTRMTKTFKENYLHHIGNLTIDPNSSNASKGNNIWLIKKTKYFEKAPFKTQLELSDFVGSRKKIWGVNEIEKRTKKILDFVDKFWKV